LSIFKQSIVARYGNRYPFFHFDIFAGSGWNSEAECIGSPVAFVREASAQGIVNFRAHFCDINQSACGALLNHREIGWDERCFIHHGDNSGLVLAIPDLIRAAGDDPAEAIGTVVVDPNGCDVPIEDLAMLNRLAPKLDVILNVGATSFKRVRKYKENHGHDDAIDLRFLMDRIGKAHWQIREPQGRNQWTLLVGRNGVRAGSHRALGFHDVESDYGQHLFNVCNLTPEELPRAAGQTDMFGYPAPAPPSRAPARRVPKPQLSAVAPQDIPRDRLKFLDYYGDYLKHPVFRAIRAYAMRRDGDACQSCGKAASQVHHWRDEPDRYPKPWGTFDTATNIKAICHECHCEEHGKER
jgi:hypothetical protein